MTVMVMMFKTCGMDEMKGEDMSLVETCMDSIGRIKDSTKILCEYFESMMQI
jgi:hypothetical protein